VMRGDGAAFALGHCRGPMRGGGSTVTKYAASRRVTPGGAAEVGLRGRQGGGAAGGSGSGSGSAPGHRLLRTGMLYGEGLALGCGGRLHPRSRLERRVREVRSANGSRSTLTLSRLYLAIVG